MRGPDFIIIVGRDRATITPQTRSATVWLNTNMVTGRGYCIVDREGVEDIVKFIEDSHWTVEVH